MFCGYIIRYLTLFGTIIIATYRKDNSSVTFLESSRMKGSARPDVMLQTLEDGLLAARTGELREKIAVWTILVNIHQPATPKLEEINALGKHLESLQHVLPIDVIRIWTNRLMIIKKESETLALISRERSLCDNGLCKISRTKRGLFNFGGSILNSLFGLATTDQLAEYKRHVEISRRNQQTIANRVNDMITVVNHTLKEVENEKRHIGNLKRYIVNLRNAIDEDRNASNRLQQQVARIQIELHLERVTTALENVIDTYNTAWKKYFTQRTSLENGHLTEHLLPRKKLIDILELTTSNDMNPVSNVDWYYQYTLIEPIWSKDNELIYKAEIPLVSNTQYIHYVLNSWPVPVGNHTMQIDVNTEIALNTRDGDMFYPKACIGRNPTVCATGPVYNTEHEQCIRGIITGRRTDRNVCRVIIRKTVNKQSRITDLSLNEYIVIFHRDTNLILRCYGSREKSMKITKGVYKTKLKENCTLSCKTWKIKGIHKSIKKVSIFSRQILDLIPLNMTKQVPDKPLEKLGPLKFDETGPLIKVPIDPLTLFEDHDSHRNKRFSLFEIGIMTSIVLITLGIFIYTLKTIMNKYAKYICQNKGKEQKQIELEPTAFEGNIFKKSNISKFPNRFSDDGTNDNSKDICSNSTQ